MNQLQKRFYSHYRRKNILKFPEQQLIEFCQLLSLSNQSSLQLKILQSLSRTSNGIFIYLKNLQQFIIYSNDQQIPINVYINIIKKLESSFEKLKNVRCYFKMMLSDQKNLNDIDHIFIKILPSVDLNLRINEITNKQKDAILIATQKNLKKNEKWLNLKKQKLKNSRQNSIIQIQYDASIEKKMKQIYIKEINISMCKSGTQILKEIEWLNNNCKKQYNIRLDDDFKNKIQIWNLKYPNTAINLHNLQIFYANLHQKIIKQQQIKSKLQIHILQNLKKSSRLQTSIIFYSLALFIWIQKRKSDTLNILHFFEFNEQIVWRLISFITLNEALALPNTLKKFMFYLEEELMILNLRIKKYIKMSQQLEEIQNDNLVNKQYFQRLKQHINLRFLQINNIYGCEFTEYYHYIIDKIKLYDQSNQILLDQILLCCIYSGYRIFLLKQIKFNQIIKTYNKLFINNPNIITVKVANQQLDIIQFYNTHFINLIKQQQLNSIKINKQTHINPAFLLMHQSLKLDYYS